MQVYLQGRKFENRWHTLYRLYARTAYLQCPPSSGINGLNLVTKERTLDMPMFF
jgi:hypothetical protein